MAPSKIAPIGPLRRGTAGHLGDRLIIQIDHKDDFTAEATDPQGVHHGRLLAGRAHAKETNGLSRAFMLRLKDIQALDRPEGPAQVIQLGPQCRNTPARPQITQRFHAFSLRPFLTPKHQIYKVLKYALSANQPLQTQE